MIDRQMLNDAICGTDLSRVTPPSIVTRERLGYYTGGFNDFWTWERHKIEALHDDDAERLYREIRETLSRSIATERDHAAEYFAERRAKKIAAMSGEIL